MFSSDIFFTIALWLYDKDLALTHGVDTELVPTQLRELELLGYQFEPPFAEDWLRCLTK